MMADFASLGIKIDARDVKAANDALDKFATASKNAEQASKANESQSVKTNLSYEKMILKLTESKSAYNQAILASKSFTAEQIAGVSAAERYANSQKSLISQLFSLKNAFATAAGGLALMQIYQASKDVVMLADKMTLLDSRVKIATKTTEDYSFASKELVAISLRTGTSLESNYTIFSRINQAMESLGGNVKNTTAFTETLAQSLRISGASAGEASSTIRQMSQAMSSGVLRGDEFNSVMENSPRLARALADGLGVSIGSLRLMAEHGELTSKKVIEAIQSQSSVLKAEYAAIPLTIGAALENINTSFSAYILNVNKATGSTNDLALGFNFISNNMTPILDGIITLGEIYAAVFAGKMIKNLSLYIASTYEATIATQAQAAATTELAVAAETAAIAEMEVAAASTTASTGAAGLSTALGLVNAGVVAFIGYKLANYLSELAVVQKPLSEMFWFFSKGIESSNYQLAVGKAFLSGNSEEVKRLTKEHENQVDVYDSVINFMRETNGVKQDDIKITGEQTAILESLKTPQETFIKNTADLGVLYNSNKITLEQYTDGLNKYANAMDMAMGAGKQTEAGKALDKLKEKYDKLTLSSEAFSKKYAYKMIGTPEEIKAVEEYTNKINALEDANKKQKKAQQEAESEAKKSVTEKENHTKKINEMLYALDSEHKVNSLIGRQKEKELELREKLKIAVGNEVEQVTKAVEQKYKDLDNNDFILAKNAEIDKYKELTLSAKEYYEYTMAKQGFKPEQIKELSGLHNKTIKEEEKQKTQQDARSELEKYNEELDKSNSKMADFGKLSGAVFDGALGGINAMTGAFMNMIDSLETINKEIEIEANKRAENDSRTNLSFIEKQLQAENHAKSIIKEKELQKDKVQAELSGARQLAAGAAKMFDEKSNAAKAFHNIEIALGVAQMAIEAQKAVVYIAGIPARLAAGAAEMFAQSGWGGFAGIAAMGAVMAGLGYAAFSGGGGSQQKPTYSSGSGSVLGDSSVQSESIDKTYKLLKDIHADEYAELKSINNGINDLNSGISNVITRLFQSNNLVNFAPVRSTRNGGLLSAIFGGKITQSVVGQGISTGETSLSSILGGGNLSAQQFATIETKTKGGWFGKDRYSYSTQYDGLDSATQSALNTVFKSMGQTMIVLADNLGAGISDRVRNYIIPALTVDLKGLSGEEAAKRMNGVISAALDSMSSTVFGDIVGQYQQLGEGMLETTTRIVTQMVVVKDALKATGTRLSGDIIAISDAIATASGGISEFKNNLSSYYDNFFSESERNNISLEQMTSRLSAVNLVLPKTSEGYKKLIQSLNLSNEADAQRYAILMANAQAAGAYYKILQTNLNSQRALDIKSMELVGNASGALAERRKDELAAMDASLRPTQIFINALTDANSAISKAADHLSSSLGNLKTISGQITSAIQAGTNANDITLKRRTEAMNLLLSAKSSGQSLDTITGLTQALTDVGKPSENLYTNSLDYKRAQALTKNILTDLSKTATDQIDYAQKQLDAANGTTTAVYTVRDALIELKDAMTGRRTIVNDYLSTLSSKLATTKSVYDAANQLASANKDKALNYESSKVNPQKALVNDLSNELSGYKSQSSATQATINSWLAYYQQAQANGNGSEAAKASKKIDELRAEKKTYDDIINSKSPELLLQNQVLNAMTAGLSQLNLLASKSLNAAQKAYVPYSLAQSQYDTLAAQLNVPSLDVGTNYVPTDMFANIHEGERIIPRADNEELLMRLSSPSNSDTSALEARLLAIQMELAALRASSEDSARNSRRTADTLTRVTQDGDSMLVTNA